MEKNYRQKIFDLELKIANTDNKVELLKLKNSLKEFKREYSLYLYNKKSGEKKSR